MKNLISAARHPELVEGSVPLVAVDLRATVPCGKEAMELRGQLRSQMEFENEGNGL